MAWQRLSRQRRRQGEVHLRPVGAPLPEERIRLLVDLSDGAEEVGVAEMPADSQVCNCNGVTKGDIVGFTDLTAIRPLLSVVSENVCFIVAGSEELAVVNAHRLNPFTEADVLRLAAGVDSSRCVAGSAPRRRPIGRDSTRWRTTATPTTAIGATTTPATRRGGGSGTMMPPPTRYISFFIQYILLI